MMWRGMSVSWRTAYGQEAVVAGLLPTSMEIYLYRVYANTIYPRRSKVFGDREPVELSAHLTSLGLPVVGVPVKVYVDGRYIATIYTDWMGVARYMFPSGVSKGFHTFTCVYEGDFWHSPSSASDTFRFVGMQTGYFKAYVENLAEVGPADIEYRVVNDLLLQEVGVVPIGTEADMERVRYVFTMLVPEEDTRSGVEAAAVPIWVIVAVILGSIAAACLSVAALIQVIITYIIGWYQCGACGARFTTCEALREHLVTAHPELWEKIKDRFECTPPSPSPLDILGRIFYVAAGIVGAVLLIELIKTVRR